MDRWWSGRSSIPRARTAAKSTKQARIPSVWDPADVAKILQAIDRGNPCGKRDYAIILLITRLGLRGIDLKRLRFADLDWPGNRLSVVQAKTGHRVQLPLPIPVRLLIQPDWPLLLYSVGIAMASAQALNVRFSVEKMAMPPGATRDAHSRTNFAASGTCSTTSRRRW